MQDTLAIGSCLKKAREFIFWVNYSKDIQEAVEKCSLCQEQQNVLTTNQRYVSEVPPHPWHTLGSDLFYHKWLDFLVVVDYFSKFLIVRKIPNSTSSAIIKELDFIFSEYGKPYLFCSDNGPCYTSAKFKIFFDEWKIEHRTSSPHYPQSNRLVESMVKVAKHLIDKATLHRLTWNRLLLDYRCTPISSSIPSPAEILFRQKILFRIDVTFTSHQSSHKQPREKWLPGKKANFILFWWPLTTWYHMRPDSAFGFKTYHPRNGIQDPSRRRLQNQTPIGLNSMVQNIDKTPTSSSLDKHRISTLHLEHQQKCISQPLKPVPVAQPQSKQVQWMPFPQNTQQSLPQVTGRPLP